MHVAVAQLLQVSFIVLLEKLHDESPNTVMPLKHGGIFDRLGGSLFGERIGCGRIDRRED